MLLRFEANLVGMHFRPPAKDVVNLLAGGTELIVQRQPQNPYDPNAVQVLLGGFSKEGQYAALYEQFYEDPNTDRDNLIDPLPLGYICNGEKTGGKKADMITEQMDPHGITALAGKLIFDAKGGPMVELEFDPVVESQKSANPDAEEEVEGLDDGDESDFMDDEARERAARDK